MIPKRLSRLRRERGAAAVELALFLPALVMLAAGAYAGAKIMLVHADLNGVTEAAARYATRAALDPTTPDAYTFRPTGAQVAAYVDDVASFPIDDVTVSPDPATVAPDTEVAVTVRTHVDLGLLNPVFGPLFESDDPACPANAICLTSTARMREE
jgi:Flp pilus assembly protein TadG